MMQTFTCFQNLFPNQIWTECKSPPSSQKNAHSKNVLNMSGARRLHGGPRHPHQKTSPYVGRTSGRGARSCAKHMGMFFLRYEGYDLEMKPSSLSSKYCVETQVPWLRVSLPITSLEDYTSEVYFC